MAAPTVDEMVRRVRQLKPASERFVELRLDHLANPEDSPKAVHSAIRAQARVIATLRSTRAGGNFTGSVAEQLKVLKACAKAGAAIVDLEVESAEEAGKHAVEDMHGRAQLLISFHDFHETLDSLPEELKRLKAFRAGFCKIATMSNSHADNVALLRLNTPGKRAKGGQSAAVIAFGMGATGLPTRVLSLAHGAPFTYAAYTAAEAVAPGQITGEELRDSYRIKTLSPKTQVYGVIGNPIGHSISPAVHNAAFAAVRRNAVYLPFHVESLDDFLSAVRVYGLSGFSITIPHKEAMARAADWLDPEARDAGAANTVVVRKGKLHCYNTDIAGLIVPMEKRMKLRGARILVAGAGGAARAVAFGLARRKARVIVVGRRPEQAKALAEQVGGESIERNLLSGEEFDAIVHATPLGMYPDTESCFFGPGELNAPLLFETVYNPQETTLVQMARKRRMKVILGLEMFLEQAARQFDLWTGRKAPRAVMARAADQVLTPPAKVGHSNAGG